MSSEHDLLVAALNKLPPKPADSAPRESKQTYSQEMSEVVALALAEALRQRGLLTTRPSLPGEAGLSGAERRIAGAIGAKKVDVTWATEESGLLLACSIKTINFKDGTSKNYQKNVTNRRGDLLTEAITLHRRFPYAVIGGFFILDEGAEADVTEARHSTYENVHSRLKLFTGRTDTDGREEQFERLYIGLVSANPFASTIRFTEAGKLGASVSIDDAITGLLRILVERNSDFYDLDESNRLVRLGKVRKKAKRKRAAKAKGKRAAKAGAAEIVETDDETLEEDNE